MNQFLAIVSSCLCVIALGSVASAQEAGGTASASSAAKTSGPVLSPDGWQTLFNGKDLTGWKDLEIGGAGEILVKEGMMVIEDGVEITAVLYTNKTHVIDYEVQLDAMRSKGSDFFCGLTFPVNTNCLTLIVGGWGGGVIGISNLDDFDASENPTTDYINFKDKQWYHIHLKVTAKKLEMWVDKKQIIEQDIEGVRLSMRSGDIEMTEPFGLATWQTEARVKNIRIRTLK